MKKQETIWLGPEPTGLGRHVYLGILKDLEGGRIVPGQRLIETDLSAQYQVGRNAVREAIQHLAVRGVIDLAPNRSPTVRHLDLQESLEVLDVAASMTQLAVRAAALNYKRQHRRLLDDAVAEVEAASEFIDAASLGRARRHFYRALLIIGGNRELQRLFPAVGMHVFYSQYPLRSLLETRKHDYIEIANAIRNKDLAAGELAVNEHVERVRASITMPETGAWKARGANAGRIPGQ